MADFAGREAELARLEALFPVGAPVPDDAGHVRAQPHRTHDTGNEHAPPRPPVAIVGMPGAWKQDRPRRALGPPHRPRFPDGQLYLDLRGQASDGIRVPPGEAQRAFLVALGVPDQEIPAEQDARTDLYRSTLSPACGC